MKLEAIRPALPDWPRLMSEPMAAEYLSIGVTTLRTRGPEPRRKEAEREVIRLTSILNSQGRP